MLKKYASFNGPFMDLSKYQRVGIFTLIKRTKSLILSNAKRNVAYITIKWELNYVSNLICG
jgi:hypothetical protein